MKNEKKAFTPECKNMLDNLDRKIMKQEITEEEWKKEPICNLNTIYVNLHN